MRRREAEANGGALQHRSHNPEPKIGWSAPPADRERDVRSPQEAQKRHRHDGKDARDHAAPPAAERDIWDEL
jgi:hypothetical protein